MKKNWSNVEVRQKLAPSAKILYFLFSKWVTMDKKNMKTGNKGSNYAKTGMFIGFIFRMQHFFPVFWRGEFFHPPGVAFGQNIYLYDFTLSDILAMWRRNSTSGDVRGGGVEKLASRPQKGGLRK